MVAYTHKYWRMVSVYSITHFLVDFACAFLMFRSIAETSDGYLCVLLYNFCAFAMQMPLGIIADKCNKNFLFAAAGCGLVCIAYGILHIPIAAVIIVGIGNAMFHIGGGIDVLNISEKKMGALGVFVSPGAFGIYLGTILGKGNSLTVTPILLSAVLAAAFVILIMRKLNSGSYIDNAAFSPKSTIPRKTFLVVACFFLVVCLRSFMGLALNLPWKSVANWGVALVCAVVMGKTAGGFLSDKFGMNKISVLSLGLAALLFFFVQTPISGTAALFLFNMTMPITLWCMAKMFPGAKGFSFGLLTFALFIGFLPIYMGIKIPQDASWLLALGAAVSLAFLWIGLRKIKV